MDITYKMESTIKIVAIAPMAKVTTPILRFNFSEEIMSMIADFAKLHRFDDRKIYKEHWDAWFEENNDELELELYRLEKNGYKGDIKDKMYKAGRYYFRKKQLTLETEPVTNINDTDISTNKTTRTYITMDKLLIEAMDKHIIENMRSHSAYGLPFKPAIGWTDFCKTCDELVDDEQKRLEQEHAIDSDVISEKIKKTYKNRYFIITR